MLLSRTSAWFKPNHIKVRFSSDGLKLSFSSLLFINLHFDLLIKQGRQGTLVGRQGRDLGEIMRGHWGGHWWDGGQVQCRLEHFECRCSPGFAEHVLLHLEALRWLFFWFNLGVSALLLKPKHLVSLLNTLLFFSFAQHFHKLVPHDVFQVVSYQKILVMGCLILWQEHWEGFWCCWFWSYAEKVRGPQIVLTQVF